MSALSTNATSKSDLAQQQHHPPEKTHGAGASRDVEQQPDLRQDGTTDDTSTFKSLGILDRFLAVWIFLAMLIGILLGNFVPNAGPALQQGKFVGVSVPIGESIHGRLYCRTIEPLTKSSGWPAGDDVPNPVQSAVRKAPRDISHERNLDSTRLQCRHQLDNCALFNGR